MRKHDKGKKFQLIFKMSGVEYCCHNCIYRETGSLFCSDMYHNEYNTKNGISVYVVCDNHILDKDLKL